MLSVITEGPVYVILTLDCSLLPRNQSINGVSMNPFDLDYVHRRFRFALNLQARDLFPAEGFSKDFPSKIIVNSLTTRSFLCGILVFFSENLVFCFMLIFNGASFS